MEDQKEVSWWMNGHPDDGNSGGSYVCRFTDGGTPLILGSHSPDLLGCPTSSQVVGQPHRAIRL
jgi:hypothetical protein